MHTIHFAGIPVPDSASFQISAEKAANQPERYQPAPKRSPRQPSAHELTRELVGWGLPPAGVNQPAWR